MQLGFYFFFMKHQIDEDKGHDEPEGAIEKDNIVAKDIDEFSQ